MIIPALTVWQPYASLIIKGHKPYEFRNYRMRGKMIGRRIAIHAGLRKASEMDIADLQTMLGRGHGWEYAGLRESAAAFFDDPTPWPFGAVLGTAVIGPSLTPESVRATFGGDGPASLRSWAWPLTEIVEFDQPIPAKGAQGFWYWDASKAA
ncbi:MAG: hypothetical protein LRY54_04130 [Alphaproteobacteria bacterium]|nr:hypothetical protein [Alphaproteobacteria bacterium]